MMRVARRTAVPARHSSLGATRMMPTGDPSCTSCWLLQFHVLLHFQSAALTVGLMSLHILWASLPLFQHCLGCGHWCDADSWSPHTFLSPLLSSGHPNTCCKSCITSNPCRLLIMHMHLLLLQQPLQADSAYACAACS